MPLENLFELIEHLRGRIESREDSLRKSEALTRYVLIDPLLRELGWDTGDPEQVQPEFGVGAKRADYALLRDGKPLVMVEAKSLGTPLQGSAIEQGVHYCVLNGTPYFVLTDGQHWELYETFKAAPLDDKRLVAFDVSERSPAEAALKALVLWRQSVQPERATTAEIPTIQPTTNESYVSSPMPVQPRADTHESTGLPTITRGQLQAMPDGQLVLCPSHPDGIDFLTTHNAWAFVRIAQAPKYFALYVSQPVYEIQYVGEIDSIIDPATMDSPVSMDHPAYAPGRKLIALKSGRLWALSEPVEYGELGAGKAPQGPRYLQLHSLAAAATLDDL